MKSTTATRLALYVAANPVLSALLTLLVLLVALWTHSPPLLVLSGLMAFGRPLLYCALLNAKPGSATSKPLERRSSSDRRAANRSIALGTR